MFDVKEKRVKLRTLEKKPIKYIDETQMKVTLLSVSDIENAKKYLPELVMSTWNEDINKFNKSLSDADRERFFFRVLQGKFIPTALISISVTFKIENMCWHDVSHLIRHTGFSFAADCSGDKIIEDRPIVLPQAVVESNCYDKYTQAMELLQECYNDIINAGGHIQDARLMHPRTMTTFYYVTGNLDYVITFIKQRIDRQVQPKADNIMAMKLLLELCKEIPYLYYIIDPNMSNSFYIRESTTNFASKWQAPLLQNEKALEGKDIDWLYPTSRDEMIGNEIFVKEYDKLIKTFYKRKKKYLTDHPEVQKIIEDCTIGDWR